MRFFVLSDIHGSATAFSKAMDAFAAERAESLVLCGDYLNHGPRNSIPEGYDPQKLAPMINAMKAKIIGVRGNCDSEVDQMLLEFPCLGDYCVFFNAQRRFFVTHGHLYGDKNFPPLQAGDVYITGHTHISALEERDGIIFLNPGSPSIPKGGSVPGYAVIDDSSIQLKRIDGTVIRQFDL